MTEASRLMLIAGVLLAAGVLSSRLSARSGVPLVLLFVGIGLVAGPEGPLGVEIRSVDFASRISLVFLALILFDGGLSTPLAQVARLAAPAVSLATVGVIITAAAVAATAVLLFGMDWSEGLLLGSVLGSTDAAAVFSALRGQGGTLRRRLKAILELESGLNDPLAVFLTVALTASLLRGEAPPTGWAIAAAFATQMAIGTAAGLAVGWGASRLMRGVRLDAAGLYLVLTTALALLAFGAAQELGGSGVISVYVAGVIVGNARVPALQGIRRFHDGSAWLAQVGVFVLLGLLALPSRLLAEAPRGLVLALVLALVARPIAVFVSTAPFRLGWRDRLVIACGGLRGAVPVILATIPLAAGAPDAARIFHLVFFAVLVSVLIQGTALVPLARRLGLLVPSRGEPPVSLEFTALRETGHQLLGYRVEPGSLAAGRAVRDLPLPGDALVTLVVRGAEIVPPQPGTAVLADDVVYVLHATASGGAVAEVFTTAVPDEAALPAEVEVPFPLDARLTTLADVEAFYGVKLAPEGDQTLADWLAERLPGPAAPGQRVPLDGIDLVIASVQDGRPHLVGIEVRGPAG